MNIKRLLRKTMVCVVCALGAVSVQAAPKTLELHSPDGKLTLQVTLKEKVTYSLVHQGDLMIGESPISMTLTDGTILGLGRETPKIRRSSADELFPTVIYRKSHVRDHYNQLQLSYKDFDLEFRAYDSGAAYRFVIKKKGAFKVESEQATFHFPEDWNAYIPYVRDIDNEDFDRQYTNSFENQYAYIRLSEWDSRRLAFLPLLVEGPNGKKVQLTEADLQNYPGMYLYNGDKNCSLEAKFAPLPDLVEQGGHNNLQGMVKTRKPYIAEYDQHSERKNGNITFPWRIMAISEKDIDLVDNDMVFCLAEPQRPDLDFSWIKPGKVAWDWWNDWNLYGVDFKAGINDETYMYYIDFAAEHHIPYVILDEGWAVNGEADLLQVIPEINLQKLIDYGAEKNVGIILWAGYWAFNRDVDGLCKHFAEMGVKGFKVDFMDRDDQYIVNFIRRSAEIAARYHLIMDFHGTYKPTGLQRTWPNAINYEGVYGLEQMKWADEEKDQVTYDVTIPFIRMFAGPFDYTQGAMRNAAKGNYRPVNSEAMSQGTRCRQLAEYVVFESPFNMLCDSPSNYKKEPECTEFIAEVPETWDETRVLDGKVADFIAVARRKGDIWYVGAMTDWVERDLTIDLSFLKAGNFKLDIFKDGINADRAAQDYVHQCCNLPAERQLKLHIAPGGGFVIKITPDNL